MELSVEQKHFGPVSMLVCLLAISTMLMLAIDMYIPALPSMQREFDVSASFLNLTVFAFLIVSAIGVILAAPISDRIGRKPTLMGCCALFTLSSLACALSPEVWVLIAFRMCEALAFGGVITLGTAIISDAYSGKSRKLAMSALQSMVIIGPMLAPFVGTFILSISSWRGIFLALTLLGAISFGLSMLLTETLPESNRTTGGVGASLSQTWDKAKILAKRRSFTSFALLMGVAGIPYFAFIATVSYILLDGFGLTYMGYNIVYAAACIVTVIAPFVYVRISKHLYPNTIVMICIGLAIVSTLLMLIVGDMSPLIFFIAFVPYALMEGIIRPMGFILLLDQKPEFVGAASSFTNFAYTVITALGSVFGTLQWPSYIFGIGVIMAASTVVMCLLFSLWKSGVRKPEDR